LHSAQIGIEVAAVADLAQEICPRDRRTPEGLAFQKAEIEEVVADHRGSWNQS
jgi:hypothetical protein